MDLISSFEETLGSKSRIKESPITSDLVALKGNGLALALISGSSFGQSEVRGSDQY